MVERRANDAPELTPPYSHELLLLVALKRDIVEEEENMS